MLYNQGDRNKHLITSITTTTTYNGMLVCYVYIGLNAPYTAVHKHVFEFAYALECLHINMNVESLSNQFSTLYNNFLKGRLR
jgi:hypothetical protein